MVARIHRIVFPIVVQNAAICSIIVGISILTRQKWIDLNLVSGDTDILSVFHQILNQFPLVKEIHHLFGARSLIDV